MMQNSQRGDTLIEVLLGIIILSSVVVGAITLMGTGINQVLVSTEHTEVRSQLNAQTSLLQYLRDQYVANNHVGTWATILSTHTNNVASSAIPAQTDTTCVPQVNNEFYIKQTNTGSVLNPPTIATSIGTPLTYARAGNGIWIEAYRPTDVDPSAPKYIDFVIRGCWQPAGAGVEQQEATIVRLYDGN